MKPLDDVSTKASQKTVKKTAKENKKKKIKKDDSCIFRGESYNEEDDQPTENWIQCSICTQWCHEECLAFEGRENFVCHN